ncbi:MAG: bifunctional metallophosphatase/5'-nucleotidase [Deltaproteobacteria bacterium]|nr:bifunctional metallophosphatase/5'-nucleotidase [Deltaproteobacteria bacterium]
MRLLFRLCLALLGASLASCLKRTEAQSLAGQDVRLTVLHTSDLHSRLLPYEATPGLIDRGLGLCAELQPLGGVARMSYLLERERARGFRVMHLDSGDCFQGAPIFNSFRGEVEIKVMAAFRPDAVVVGNHEFDLGARNLAEQYGRFGQGVYPLLAANYLWSSPGDPNGNNLGALVKPYEIRNVFGLKVAVIGMGNTSSMTSLKDGGNSTGITPLEPIETLRAWVNILEPQVDLIFVVSHQGLTSKTEPNLGEDVEMITGYERIVPPDAVPDCIVDDPTLKHPCWQLVAEEPDGQLRVFIPGVVGIDAMFGGHLHIVLNPPKVLVDPAGRKVPLVHSGAFAKFFGRFDAVVRMPPKDADPVEVAHGAEIISHTYGLTPITNRIPKKTPTAVVGCPMDESATFEVEDATDAVGPETQCQSLFGAAQQRTLCKLADECRLRGDACTKECRDARRDCYSVPAPVDPRMLELLDPYVIGLYQDQDLNKSFAFATDKISRFGLSGEDSPLGNLVADSMRKRNRVEAQFAMTNSLGIRTNMEKGLVSIEEMFNIFPFENTLTTMFLSGVEVQELFDFVTERSAGRGCQTQAQISGISFVMNCAQALRNDRSPECEVAEDCGDWSADSSASPVKCVLNHCYRSPAEQILIQGEPLNPTESYKTAVNDFIGRGGSGFEVLRRNTTKIETSLSLRDALIDYMRADQASGGPGRVCGSPFMVEPLPAQTRPFLILDKASGASCAAPPQGCKEPSGRLLDCHESEEDPNVRFFCIPYDFRQCSELEQFAEKLESVPDGSCENAPVMHCDGQVHCCNRTLEDGASVADYYCMVPNCIDPPATGRIQRIVQ